MFRRFAFDTRIILAGLTIGLVLVEVLNYVNASAEDGSALGFVAHLYSTYRSEALTIVFAVLIIDVLNKRRHTQREKQTLIRRLGSPEAILTAEAVRELRTHGWLTDGTLRGGFLINADLSNAALWQADLREAAMMEANLAGANFHRAKLGRARLWQANLHSAELMQASLYKADLRKANLEQAQLWQADSRSANFELVNLQQADLREANLQDAVLDRADLRGANLHQAQLTNASLHHARFSDQTTLPDGTPWQASTDLERFTRPTHPDYWHTPRQQHSAYPSSHPPDDGAQIAV